MRAQQRLLRAAGTRPDAELINFEAGYGDPRAAVRLGRRLWTEAPSVREDSHPLVGPSITAHTSSDTPAIDSTMPSGSNLAIVVSRDVGTTRAISAIETSTIGTFTRSTEPQKKCSSRKPPVTGPSATDKPLVAAQMPIALGRSFGSRNTLTTILLAIDGSPAADEAGRAAIALARLTGAALHVVHAWYVPAEHAEWVHARAVRMRDALLKAGYPVHGDPDRLLPVDRNGAPEPSDAGVLALALHLLLESKKP